MTNGVIREEWRMTPLASMSHVRRRGSIPAGALWPGRSGRRKRRSCGKTRRDTGGACGVHPPGIIDCPRHHGHPRRHCPARLQPATSCSHARQTRSGSSWLWHRRRRCLPVPEWGVCNKRTDGRPRPLRMAEQLRQATRLP